MKGDMHYFRSKIKALREEYAEPDKAEVIKAKGGKCELCGRKTGDTYVFGPTHYIKRKVLFKVNVHVHKIKSGGHVHKVVICDGCHLSYHLFTRLDPDAVFGGRTIKDVSDSVLKREMKVITKFVRRPRRK